MTDNEITPEEADKRNRLATMLRAAKREFNMSGDAMVTFQKVGGRPVRIRLDDLLKRIEGKSPPHP